MTNVSKDCKLPQIISQTLTSDGVLTQILPESTSCKIASDYSSVVLKDSVAETTKVINVRGGPAGGHSFNIRLDQNRLIFKSWSEIGMFCSRNNKSKQVMGNLITPITFILP